MVHSYFYLVYSETTIWSMSAKLNLAGFCVAIGGCDIRISSRKAKMGLNFVKIGLHPGKK